MKMLNDEFFMKEAIKEAEKGFEENEVPIGAVIVKEGIVIARAHNQVRMLKNPTAHAEMLAITQACQALNSPYLDDCCLYVTVEPCIMCIGALLHARIGVIYYGVEEPIYGALGSRVNLTKEFGSSLRKIESGLLRPRAQNLLRLFFHRCRNINKMERWLSG